MEPFVPRHIADVLATKLTEAIRGLGGNPSALTILPRDTGLLISMTQGGKTVAAVLPPDFKADYIDVAATLLQQHAMLLTVPDIPRIIFDD